MSDFSDYLASLTGSSSATFSPGSATPYANGITQNVLSGSVNVGSHTGSVDTELLSHQGGTSGHSLAGTMTTPTSVSVQQAAMALYGLRPDEIKALQDRLVAAGYITPKDIDTPGTVDGATAKAYGDLLQDTSAYNAAGNALTVSDLLTQRSSARAAAGLTSTSGGAGGSGPLNYQTDVHTYSPTDPAQVRLTAESAFRQALGRKPKKAELDTFVKHFTGEEMSAQAQVFNAQDQTRSAYIGREMAATGGASGQTTGSPKLVTVTAGGASFTVAAEAAPAFTGFVNELVANGYQPHSVQGYNDRNISINGKDTGVKSEHAKGFAIDIDPQKNPDGSHKNALPADVAQIAAKYGLKWGGNFKSRSPDPMHFEWKGGGVQAASAVAPQPVAGPAGAPAPVSTSVTAVQPDLSAQAVEFARQSNPAETQAYDIGQQFQNFLSILGKPVV